MKAINVRTPINFDPFTPIRCGSVVTPHFFSCSMSRISKGIQIANMKRKRSTKSANDDFVNASMLLSKRGMVTVVYAHTKAIVLILISSTSLSLFFFPLNLNRGIE